MADTPVGTIAAFAGPGPGTAAWENATGWLLCDGRSLQRTTLDYSALFNAIGSSWGGDGVDAFNVPDLRGLFLRGVDGGAGRDPDVASRTAIAPGGHAGDAVGSLEGDQIRQHAHPASITPNPHQHQSLAPQGQGGSERGGREGLGWVDTSATSLTVTVDGFGGSETRPVNASVFWIIRYK
ncbi:MAG TPA: phage tail protein [Candidatus Sulfotelmatobacter sp.]|nr:phage tail protein [Candidatus Sulfotelmatobacter sp.]